MWVAFIAALVGGLAAAMASMIGRALIALSVGFITYKGIDVAIGVMKAKVIASFSGMPADMVGLLGYLWVDKALTLVFAGFATAISMHLVGGSLKKAVFK